MRNMKTLFSDFIQDEEMTYRLYPNKFNVDICRTQMTLISSICNRLPSSDNFNPQTDKGNINLNFGIPNGINYLKLFENDTFINALLNTLLLSVLVTPVSVLIGIMACYGI